MLPKLVVKNAATLMCKGNYIVSDVQWQSVKLERQVPERDDVVHDVGDSIPEKMP